jgi:Glycosyl transferase family 2
VSVTGRSASVGSVIVRCGERLDLTRRCIASLVRHTRSPWELIVLDDGEGVETAAYLAGLQYASPVRVVVVPDPGDGDLARFLEVARGHSLVMVEGGWLVWHEVGNPVPWVRVREAIEHAEFAETVEHVEGTMVAFFRNEAGVAAREAGAASRHENLSTSPRTM